MMRAGLLISALCFGAGNSLAAPPSPSQTENSNLELCVRKARIDSESASCFEAARMAADKRMNAAYARLRKVLEPAQFAKLQDAQRKWIAFRDADRASTLAIYCPNYCGTLDTVVIAQANYRAVKERADELEKLLIAFVESVSP